MKKRWMGYLVIAVAIMVTGGCAGGPETGDQSSNANQAAKVDVNWNDEPAGILSVTNNIDESLILFAGSINNQNIIGGIRNFGSRYFDVFDDVPAGSGSFLLRAVKETNYRAKGSNLAEDDIIFAHIVSYDTRNPREVRIKRVLMNKFKPS